MLNVVAKQINDIKPAIVDTYITRLTENQWVLLSDMLV
jgi:hypothetical protein